MKQTITNLNFTGHPIYIGLDVHKKSWSVTILTKDFEHKSFTQPPEPVFLIKYLKRNFPGANYQCAYEAGFSGYHWQRELQTEGINCMVVHPADIPITDKEKKRKQDKVDSRKLANTLRSGLLKAIYIPTVVQEQDRALTRARYRIVQDTIRVQNRVKSFLSFHGVQIPEEYTRCWTKKFIEWLFKVQFTEYSATYSLRCYLEELQFLRNQVSQMNIQIRKLAKEERYKTQIKHLTSIPSIGLLSAMIISTEIGNINRFKSLDQLCGYVGLVPNIRSSADDNHVGHMTKRGNSLLRTLLIENSWIAVKKEPALILAYDQLKKRMPANKAIVRIARKLLSRVRFVLKNKCDYEMILAKENQTPEL